MGGQQVIFAFNVYNPEDAQRCGLAGDAEKAPVTLHVCKSTVLDPQSHTHLGGFSK